MYVIRKLNQDLRLSGILSSVRWHFFTDVLGQPIVPIFKSQPVQEGCPESRQPTTIIRCVTS
jgi:hypothetical protein